jgi:hypothetical protein
MFSCASLDKPKIKSNEINKAEKKTYAKQREVLLKSYPSERPSWIYEEPNEKDGYLVFVSMSGNNATEIEARKDAMKNVIKVCADYCGVEVKDLNKKIKASFGKSSEVNDPTVASLGQTTMKTDSFVSRIKAKKWYVQELGYVSDNMILEKYYKVYVLATFPKDEYIKVQQLKNK